MTHFDRTIAGLHEKSARVRATLRRNAEAMLRRVPGHPDARRLLDALNAIETERSAPAHRHVTGLLAWETYRAGATTFLGYHGDQVVGRIFMRANCHAVSIQCVCQRFCQARGGLRWKCWLWNKPGVCSGGSWPGSSGIGRSGSVVMWLPRTPSGNVSNSFRSAFVPPKMANIAM